MYSQADTKVKKLLLHGFHFIFDRKVSGGSSKISEPMYYPDKPCPNFTHISFFVYKMYYHSATVVIVVTVVIYDITCMITIPQWS